MSYLQINIDFDTVSKGERYGDCGNFLFPKWASISKKLIILYDPKDTISGTLNCVIIVKHEMC
jgi:hypothetical protein